VLSFKWLKREIQVHAGSVVLMCTVQESLFVSVSASEESFTDNCLLPQIMMRVVRKIFLNVQHISPEFWPQFIIALTWLYLEITFSTFTWCSERVRKCFKKCSLLIKVYTFYTSVYIVLCDWHTSYHLYYIDKMLNMMFAWWWLWRLLSSGMGCHVVW
jgi:hypothetical protein